MIKYILITSCFLFTIISINSVFAQENNTLVFEDKFLGIKFEYPESWQFPDVIYREIPDVIMTYPKSCNIQSDCSYPDISPRIELGIRTIDEPDTFVLDDHVREKINGYMKLQNSPESEHVYGLLAGKDIEEGYKSIALNQTTLAGNRAIQHIYEEFSMLTFQKEKKIDVEMFAKNKLYTITYTTQSDKEFKQYLPVFNKILETYELIPLL